jgi:hypothetical protein
MFAAAVLITIRGMGFRYQSLLGVRLAGSILTPDTRHLKPY